MISPSLSIWLDRKVYSRSSIRPNAEHVSIFRSLFESKITVPEAVEQLTQAIAQSKKKNNGPAYNVRQLILSLVTEHPETHEILLQLVSSCLPPEKDHFLNTWAWDWREVYSSVQGMKGLERYLDGVDIRPPIAISPADMVVNFTAFSAKLARCTGEKDAFVFFDCRQALEASDETYERRIGLLTQPVVTASQLRAIDVEVAAQWIIYAGPEIFEYKNDDEKFGGWQRGFAMTTDRWNGEPGFSQERWKLWQEEFSRFAKLPEGDVPIRIAEASRKASEIIANSY